jgi:hypothetical protein
MSLGRAPDAEVLPLLRILDDMQSQLDADERHLSLLVEEARKLAARGGSESPLPSTLRSEVLARLDRHAVDLEYRQRIILDLVDSQVSASAAVSQSVLSEPDPWAKPWQPPEIAVSRDDGTPSRRRVSLEDRHRRQLARVLTVVGTLLIVCALLVGVL